MAQLISRQFYLVSKVNPKNKMFENQVRGLYFSKEK